MRGHQRAMRGHQETRKGQEEGTGHDSLSHTSLTVTFPLLGMRDGALFGLLSVAGCHTVCITCCLLSCPNQDSIYFLNISRTSKPVYVPSYIPSTHMLSYMVHLYV